MAAWGRLGRQRGGRSSYTALAAAADARLLRQIATDAAARRGIHRLMGIARAAGYGEIAVAGVRLRQTAATSHEGTEPLPLVSAVWSVHSGS